MRRHPSSARAGAIWRRVLSLPVALVIALTAGASAGAQAAAEPAATPRVASSLAGTWRLLPKAPVTTSPADQTAVWTGHEMITHGNYYPSAGGIRGVTFAYRPASRTWVRLANGPHRPSAYETGDVAVWTGSRVLVPGQTSAIYNPATNTWRPMPFAPMSMFGAVTGWTGRRFFIWGGTCCEDTSHDGFAYNPVTNTWHKLPTAPLSVRRSASGTWTGRALVVAGGFKFGPDHTIIPFRDAAAYNPATRKWRKIAPMPRREYGATAVWDGKEILFIGGWGQNGLTSRGLAYNPAANRWRLLPAMAYPRSRFAAVWTGLRLLVWGGLTANGTPPPHGEAFTPATNKWTALPASPLRGRADPVAVWTGHRMIIWGGSGRTDGATYTPAG
jgi:hypothetical protein